MRVTPGSSAAHPLKNRAHGLLDRGLAPIGVHIDRSRTMDEHKLFAAVGTWMAVGALALAVAAPLLMI